MREQRHFALKRKGMKRALERAVAVKRREKGYNTDHLFCSVLDMLHEIRDPYIQLYLTARERLHDTAGPSRVILNPQMRLGNRALPRLQGGCTSERCPPLHKKPRTLLEEVVFPYDR